MNQNWMLLSGAALGAGAMFLLDPRGGARRRALIRDKMVHATHTTGDALDALAHDVTNRTRGMAAETAGALRRERVDARKLQERVRAQLGHAVSHPRAIDVHTSDEGHVELVGPVLAHEADTLIAAIRTVRGVRSVDDRLERHETAEGVPSLQGGSPRPDQPSGWIGGSWSPTAKALLVSTAVAAGLGYAALGRNGS